MIPFDGFLKRHPIHTEQAIIILYGVGMLLDRIPSSMIRNITYWALSNQNLLQEINRHGKENVIAFQFYRWWNTAGVRTNIGTSLCVSL